MIVKIVHVGLKGLSLEIVEKSVRSVHNIADKLSAPHRKLQTNIHGFWQTIPPHNIAADNLIEFWPTSHLQYSITINVLVL